METRLVTSENWELLFSSLLTSKINHDSFSITTTHSELIIHSKEQTLQKTIAAALSSPEAARTSVSYSLLDRVDESSIPTAHPTLTEPFYPPILEINSGIGQLIFEKLFGDKITKRIGHIKWNAELERENCHVLYAHCEEGLEDLSALQVKKYKEVLSKASFSELRKALASKEEFYSPLTLKDGAINGILESHIDKILTIQTNHAKQTIYFDFGLLAKCLTPPRLLQAPIDEEKEISFEIRIDKNHLMSYLSIIFNEGFILNISHNQEKHEAQPICFSMQRAIPVNNSLTLILDCSTSMEQCFPSYIKQVKDFIIKLSEEKDYADATIRIKPFASEELASHEFALTHLDVIGRFLDSLEANGNTYLNGTIHSELKHIKSELQIKNNTIIIFSDGEDNQTSEEINSNLASLTTDLKKHTNPPKIYTLGLGEHYSKEKFADLSAITGGEHIKLDKIEDFDAIIRHLNKMGKVRRLARFIQEMKAFTVPAYEGEVSVAPIKLSVPGPFSVDGKEYYVLLEKPELVMEEKEDLAIVSINEPTATLLQEPTDLPIAAVIEPTPTLVQATQGYNSLLRHFNYLWKRDENPTVNIQQPVKPSTCIIS